MCGKKGKEKGREKEKEGKKKESKGDGGAVWELQFPVLYIL